MFKTTNIDDNGILLFPKKNVLIHHKADLHPGGRRRRAGVHKLDG